MSTAFFTPTMRGSRWVPPRPGITPSASSGRPSLVLSVTKERRLDLKRKRAKAELRTPLGGDAGVAGHGDLESAAECEGVHGSDHRLGLQLEPVEPLVLPLHQAHRIGCIGRVTVSQPWHVAKDGLQRTVEAVWSVPEQFDALLNAGNLCAGHELLIGAGDHQKLDVVVRQRFVREPVGGRREGVRQAGLLQHWPGSLVSAN